jgi:aspartate/methionine/tyrosine aminotransferase
MIFETRSGGKIVKYSPVLTCIGGSIRGAKKNALRNRPKDHKKLIVLLNFPNNPTVSVSSQTKRG